MKAGWEIKTLGEVFTTVTGNTPPKNNADFYGDFIPLVKPPELCNSLLDSAEDGLSEAGAKVARVIPENSILVSCIGNLGKVALNTVPVAFNQQINAILPDENKAIPEFMFYQTLSCRFNEQLEELASGTTVPIVNKSKFKSIRIVLAPLPEQKRLVTLLDEAFESIATAKANAQQNLKNARALFESHLNEVFTKRGEGWEEKTLGDLATFRNGINFTKSSKGDSIKIVGVKDFQNNFFAPVDDLDTVTIDNKLPDSDVLKENDILFVRSNGNLQLIGRCMLVGAITEKMTHSGFAIRARLNDKNLLPKYICHFLKSNAARQKMIDGGNGTNIKSLNQTTLSGMVIPIPSISEQAQVVYQIENLTEETQRLEALYSRKIAALDELKKALLHRAFSGEL